ncbi:hypothetical protein PV662_31055 [Streptomyces europaeiscabiei]|uniref:Uncharacterized protein n=1 Tax=Streptomyces europaeiscabiei TaxID=146819 RepID=A0ABU4NPT3_9ACTN|nr:hypothetical protein [Streptomyces europaeiscabiei]MDX3704117.1 hypothetical protein [Streptomyces europaeiscabiei]
MSTEAEAMAVADNTEHGLASHLMAPARNTRQLCRPRHRRHPDVPHRPRSHRDRLRRPAVPRAPVRGDRGGSLLPRLRPGPGASTAPPTYSTSAPWPARRSPPDRAFTAAGYFLPQRNRRTAHHEHHPQALPA